MLVVIMPVRGCALIRPLGACRGLLVPLCVAPPGSVAQRGTGPAKRGTPLLLIVWGARSLAGVASLRGDYSLRLANVTLR